MSKRFQRSPNSPAPQNILPLQIHTAQKAAYDYLGASVFFGLLVIGVWIAGFFTEDNTFGHWVIWIVAPFLLGIALLWLIFFIRRFTLFRRIYSIRYSTERSKKIRCTKLRFLIQPVTKGLFLIVCLILIDENQQKYYYIYPKGHCPTESRAKALRDKLTGNTVDLVCYKNTNFVKSIPALNR